MSDKPAIVIAPGSWQNPSSWDIFVAKLHAAGYPTEHVSLPSVGSTETPLPGFPEDVSAIRSAITRFGAAGKKVVVLCHSSGGVSGSNAIAGCDNVNGIIYLAAFAIPKGTAIARLFQGPLPAWIDDQGDRQFLRPEHAAPSLYSDLDEENQVKWSQETTFTSAALFEGISEYEPWSEGVPCGYIFCSEDKACVPAVQEQVATRLGPQAVTATVKAGHCPFLSVPDDLLAAVTDVVERMGGKGQGTA